MLQLAPVKLALQLQTNPPYRSVHVPLPHGLEAHSLVLKRAIEPVLAPLQVSVALQAQNRALVNGSRTQVLPAVARASGVQMF